MPHLPWKYATNQFLTATEDNFSLVNEINDTHLPRLIAANNPNSEFDAAISLTTTVIQAWDTAQQGLTNAEAGLTGAQSALTHALYQLTPRPNPDTPSTLESWMHTLEGVAPFGSSLYRTLLPQNRETLTAGTQDHQIDAILAFRTRLGQQAGKPALITLGNTVAAWINPITVLRTTRDASVSFVTGARTTIQQLRLEWGAQMISNVGLAMQVYKDDIVRVESLWDVSLLQDPPQQVPTAPAVAPAWDAAIRSLTLAALPEGATRLVAWRIGPGGAPEELATGVREALSVTIPADITFTDGALYQLWVTAKNGRGQSAPSPSVSWTAA